MNQKEVSNLIKEYAELAGEAKTKTELRDIVKMMKKDFNADAMKTFIID